jgi:hypothetical protein
MAKTYKTVIYITLREEHRLMALQSRAEENTWTQHTGSERECAKPHNEMTNILYTSSIFHPFIQWRYRALASCIEVP